MASSDIEREYSEFGSDGYEDDYAYYDKPKKPPKRWGRIVAAIVIMVIIILLILVLLNPAFQEWAKNLADPSRTSFREYPEWADFTVERTLYITQQNTLAPMDYEVDIPKPEDIPPGSDPWLQDVKSVATIPTPHNETLSYSGYEWMYWEEEGISSSRTIRITYSIRTESAVWNMESSDSGTVDQIPDWMVDKYGNKTKQEWKIIPDDPGVVSKSRELTQDKITVFDKVRSIFDYLNNNYRYVTTGLGDPKYCYQTLSDKQGDCDDQSILFISLARAAGIPSWLEFGALYNHQQKSWGGHAWVRVYIPDYSGEGSIYNIDVVNDHFLFRDAYRFSEWEADGNGTHLEEYYYSHGVNFDYEESYRTIDMQTSSNKILIGSDGRPVEETISGFEATVLVSAIVLIALVTHRRRDRS